MSLVFAVVAAILLGSSDFCAARVSRHAPSVSVTRLAVLASAVLAPLLLFIDPSSWSRRDVIIAALGGVFMMSSLAVLYRGYSVAPVGIVGPTASVLIALVPVVYDVTQGLRPGPVAWVGIFLGLCALGFTSYSPGGTGSVRVGAILGVTAGVGFGVAFILMSKTSDSAGLMPVLIQRISGFVFLAIIQRFDRQPMLVTTEPGRRWSIITGVFAVIAIASLQLAFQKGSAGPVSVAASQFASVAVLLAVIFNKERLRPLQWLGVMASAIGVALMSVG